jgi:hypothetical protein
VEYVNEEGVIEKHLRNIFKKGELEKKSVWANFAHTASAGKNYQAGYYNLYGNYYGNYPGHINMMNG